MVTTTVRPFPGEVVDYLRVHNIITFVDRLVHGDAAREHGAVRE